MVSWNSDKVLAPHDSSDQGGEVHDVEWESDND